MNRTIFEAVDLATQHWVKFNVENNRICYVLTGVFIVNLVGNSPNWLNQKTIFDIPIPALPRSQGLHIEQYAPLFTLSEVFNRGTAVNSGHAIKIFDISSVNRTTDPNIGYTSAAFQVDFAISDIDAWINRIAYNVTLIGTIKPIENVDE